MGKLRKLLQILLRFKKIMIYGDFHMKLFGRIFLVIMGLSLLLVSCITEEPITPEPTNLELTLDQYLQPENWIDGYVDLRTQTLLSFQLSGQIEELLVEIGDEVDEGDLIARLDSEQLEMSLQRAEAALTIAEANLARVSSPAHPAIIREAESAVELAEADSPIGIVAEAVQAAEVKGAQARLDYLLAQPFPEEVAIAQADVDRAQVNVEAAKSMLEQAKLISPIDGSVIQIFTNTHEFAGDGDPIIQIGDLQDLVVKSEMSDFEISRIGTGDKLTITFTALPGIEVKGDVVSILPDMDNLATGDFIVVIEMDDLPEGVLWGMTAQVHIPE